MTPKEKITTTEIDSKAEKERIEAKTKPEAAKMQSIKQTEAVKPMESVYTVEELSANAEQLFDVRTECAIAALKAADIKACTVSKAKEMIKKFMDKEVR